MTIDGGTFNQIFMHTAAVALGDGAVVNTISGVTGGYTTVAMQVTGISGDTITFEGTIDGTNWVAISTTDLSTGTAATTATADGIYRMVCLGLYQVRARISTWSAGIVYVTAVAVA